MKNRNASARRRFITGLAATAATAAWAPRFAFAADPLKIGLILPQTGPFASTGRQIEAACRLYIARNGDTVAGRKVQLEIFENFEVPINMARVLHRDQKLKFHRPVLAGDKLFFDSYLDSVIESHGTVITEIRGEVTDQNGEPVVTSVVTVIGEALNEDEPDEVVAAIAARREAAIAKALGKATPVAPVASRD